MLFFTCDHLLYYIPAFGSIPNEADIIGKQRAFRGRVKRENQKAVGGITSAALAKGLIFQLDWEIGSAGFLYLFDELYST
jgi:hypothetical protein